MESSKRIAVKAFEHRSNLQIERRVIKEEIIHDYRIIVFAQCDRVILENSSTRYKVVNHTTEKATVRSASLYIVSQSILQHSIQHTTNISTTSTTTKVNVLT